MELFGYKLPPISESCVALKQDNSFLAMVDRLGVHRFNVSVLVTRNCNARCPFCISGSNRDPIPEEWNFDKYKKILKELEIIGAKVVGLGFTGGEPCYEMDRFQKMLDITLESKIGGNTYRNMNTNGSFLRNKKFTEEIAPNFHSINLSRHHWDDKINKKLFVRGGSREKDIFEWPEKQRIHFKCNLMKGGVETVEDARTYLDWAIEMNVLMAGFTGLIDVNEFTHTNSVDYDEFIKSLENDSENFNFLTKTVKGSCSCMNHYYFGRKGGIIRVWSHHVSDHEGENATQLVYDGNVLRLGYSGPIIF